MLNIQFFLNTKCGTFHKFTKNMHDNFNGDLFPLSNCTMLKKIHMNNFNEDLIPFDRNKFAMNIYGLISMETYTFNI